MAGGALEDEDAAAEEGAGKADEGSQVCVVFLRMRVCLLSVCLSVCLARLSVFLHTHARLHLSWGLCLTGKHTGW